jgi:hypothetical protein
MTVGNKIVAADYNRIRNKIIAVFGPGGTNPNTNSADPSFGYGQVLQSSAVAISNTVTKQQWDNLRWDIYNARFHQTGAAPAIVAVTANSKIQASVLNYEGFADTAITERLNVSAGLTAIETGTSQSRNFQWKNQVLCTVTVTFANAAQTRYFFNSGGQIRFASGFVKNITNAQNNTWETLLAGAGTQVFASDRIYTLTNSYITWYTTPTAASPYGANNLQLQALCNVANNSNGTANQITFRAVWTDGYVDPDPPGSSQFAPDDLVNGTLSLTVTQRRATGGTLQPTNTPFTISSPSYTISAITGT